MSGYMDEMDKEFIRNLYPQYMLEQPIAYDLWALYYKHKKLFHKTHHGNIQSSSDGITNKFNSSRFNKLSPTTKKEIWQKLMNLGVLGTISFDSANDEYLLQVYKYFYPEVLSNKEDDKVVSQEILDSEKINREYVRPNVTESMESRVRRWPGVSFDTNVMSTTTSTDTSVNNSATSDLDDNDNLTDRGDHSDEDDDENDSDHNNDSNISNDEDSNGEGNDISDLGNEDADVDEVVMIDASRRTETGPYVGNEATKDDKKDKQKHQDIKYYQSKNGTEKLPITVKSNAVSVDVYQTVGYNLPYQWVSQTNNSVIVSPDGVSRLSPNPNWQAYQSYENSPSYARNRLRINRMGNQKIEYAITWANNSLPSQHLSLFYYEIRILSVSSTQGGDNSNIIVGYKFSPFNDAETSSQFIESSQLPPGSRSTETSTGGGSHNINGSNESGGNNDIRSSLINSSSGTNNTTSKTGLEEGFFGYCGSDGTISAGSQFNDYSTAYGRDDIIGCGINFVDGSIFFTKNGIFMGTAFNDLHDINLIPAIALRPGNSVSTNFGLYEEFVFDIVSYQNRWKAKAYSHIFNSINDNNEKEEEEEDSIDPNMDKADDSDIQMNENECVSPVLMETETELEDVGQTFLIKRDKRIVGSHLVKPPNDRINSLNSSDDSIPSTLNSMINDYLIHEGLIDVAKGFLRDLQKNTYKSNDETDESKVIKHNERQIIREEKMLRIRQELRKLINDRNLDQCIKFINLQLPGILENNVELYFELKLGKFILTLIDNVGSSDVDVLVQRGQEISEMFVNNGKIPQDLRERFSEQLSNVSALLAYDDPINQAPDDLTVYLSNEYLQDRLFQIINSGVLKFLNKSSDCDLENMVGYTRSMLSTLMQYRVPGSVVENGTELRYYKGINMDEDIMNL